MRDDGFITRETSLPVLTRRRPCRSRREFNLFVRACAEYGRDAIAQIAAEFEDKTQADVEKYSVVFWDKGPEMLSDWDKHLGRVEDGERKVERLRDMILAFELKCGEYGQS